MNALSEARVIVGRYQQITSVDLTETSQIAQASLDNVVEAYLGDGYTGLAVGVDASATGIVVQPGYLVQGGRAFSLSDAFPLSLASKIATIPDATKTMNVIIVANGDESPSSETRTFEDASKKPPNPADLWATVQTFVATRMVRTIDISAVAGTPDVQPADPAFNAALFPIARVVLSNTGVVSVTPIANAKIVRQDQIAATMASLAAYQATLQDIVTGLLSGVSGLALQLASLSARELADVASLQRQIDTLRTQATTPATSTFTGQDYFLDLSQSLPTASGYAATVNGGLRFAAGPKADVPIVPQNPLDGNLQQGTGTLLYPAISTQAGQMPTDSMGDVGLNGYDGTYASFVSFGSLGSLSAPVCRRGFARTRIRSSIGLKATSPAQVLANGDPSQLFAIDPASFVYDAANWGDWKTGTTEINRQNGFWLDIASRDYWSPILGTGDVGGLPVADQPYKPFTSKMLTQFSVMTNNVVGANLRLLICGDNNGSPDFTQTIADVAAQTVSSYGASYPTSLQRFKMPYPILLTGGRQYHFVLTSDKAGLSLYLGKTQRSTDQHPTQPYLSYASGAWGAQQSGKTLTCVFSFAYFPNPTITIPLAPLQLAGGGDTADFQFSTILPQGCSQTIQVYIGGQWVNLAQVLNSSYPLAGNPSTVPCRLVLTGTGQVAPIIDTAASTSRISKSSAALQHVSSIQTPAAPVTTVHKSLVVDNWNPNVQTLTASLRTGPGFATPAVAPTSTKDVTQADGSLLRTWTWTLGAAVPSFEMELDGTTTDASQTFVGRRSNWDAAA